MENITRYLLNRHYSVESAVNLKFTYSTGDPKQITVRLGDEVTATYVDEAGNLLKVNGIITDIINKKVQGGSFRSNEQMGNGNYELQFKIDASTERNSKVVSIYLIDLYDMILGSEPTSAIITASAVNGTVDSESVEIEINADGTVVATPNENETLVKVTIDGTEYAYDTETSVFDPELPEGITITVADTVQVTIAAVTEDHTVEVTFTGSSEDPVDPENPDTPVEPTKFTITASAILGTVDSESVEVDENTNATIIATPNENTTLSKVTIDGEEYSYADSAFTSALPDNINITVDTTVKVEFIIVAENHTVEVTFVETSQEPDTPVDPEEPVDPVEPTKFTVNATSTLGTVDNASQEVEKNNTATVVVTPNENTTLSKVVVDSTEYSYNAETSVFDPELPQDVNVTVGSTVEVTISSVTDNHTIEVTFVEKTPVTPVEPTKFTVTASATLGNVDNASQEVEKDSTATVVATPNENTTLSKVTINGAEYVYADSAFTPEVSGATINVGETVEVVINTVTENINVEVTFVENVVETTKFTVTASSTLGTVESESIEVDENTDATIVVTPDENTTLSKVVVDETEYVYYTETTTFTPELPQDVNVTVDATVEVTISNVTDNHTVEVTFVENVVEPTKFTVSASAVLGTVDNVLQEIEENSSVTVVGTPTEGNVLSSVTINETEYVYADSAFTPEVPAGTSISVGETVEVIISSVTEATTIAFTFATPIPETVYHTITASATNGTVNKETSEEEEGTSISVIATPSEGNELSSISIKTGEDEAVVYTYNKDTTFFDPELPEGILVITENDSTTVSISNIQDDYTVSFEFVATV